MNKVTTSIGGGLHVAEHWRLDMTYAPFEAVNGGRYAASADLLGVGAQYKF